VPWQVNHGGGAFCFHHTFPEHGAPGEYDYSHIRDPGAPGWQDHPDLNIDFEHPSTVCPLRCGCQAGGDFTFFQTFFTLPANYPLASFQVEIGPVDDGARITIFNAAYPGGVVDPGSYVHLNHGGTTTNLTGYLVPGENRIVITHVDDCCSDSYLHGVRLYINGGRLPGC
jgi:hypothetical protein